MKINPNYKYLKATVPEQRVILLQGSTRSGKTFSVIHYLIWLCNQHEGLEIDICRHTFKSLKATVWKDFQDQLIEMGVYAQSKHNKTDGTYELAGNLISYYGADNPDKIHGRSRDILWINEAHQFPDELVNQLFPRTRHRIIADYNPALGVEHWLDPYIEKYPPMITTYKENPHLTKSQIEDIESRKDNPYWWKVYGEGKRAAPEGQIFTNWEMGSFPDIPHVYGLDFGFAGNPSALVKVGIERMNLHIEELFYLKGQTPEQLDALLRHHVKGNGLIVADKSESRLIDYLERRRHNMRKSDGGPDSVRSGVLKMCDYKIIYKGSNLKKELINYRWNDKKAGVPIKDWDHAIDAARYAFEALTKKSRGSYKSFAV